MAKVVTRIDDDDDDCRATMQSTAKYMQLELHSNQFLQLHVASEKNARYTRTKTLTNMRARKKKKIRTNRITMSEYLWEMKKNTIKTILL